MDCRSTILVNNNWLFVLINTEGDYNYKKQISFKQWVGLWRYEVILRRPHNGYWKNVLFINKGGKAGIKYANFIFMLKSKFNCMRGKHKVFAMSDECYHCKKKQPLNTQNFYSSRIK